MATSPRTTADVHRIEITVDWPPDHVAVYLIDGPEPILIDAGMAGENAQAELEAGLANAGRSLSDIDHLVLTHPHVDHIGQVSALIEAADPTIYAPAGVRARLERDPSDLEAVVRENAIAAGLEGEDCAEAVEKSVQSLERNRMLLDPSVVDHWIEHDQEFAVGGLKLRAIHTPGHQADHFCYYADFDGEPVLFSGDMLMEPFRAVVIQVGIDTGVEKGVSAFYTALDRLDGLDVSRVFPGHGESHQRLSEMIERSRGSLEKMLAGTREHVAEGPTTAMEVAYARSGERDINYVLPEVVSALEHLVSQGEIEVTVEDGVKYYGPKN